MAYDSNTISGTVTPNSGDGVNVKLYKRTGYDTYEVVSQTEAKLKDDGDYYYYFANVPVNNFYSTNGYKLEFSKSNVEPYTEYCDINTNRDNISLDPVDLHGDDNNFLFDPSTKTITGYNGIDTDVIVPSTIGGVNVTSIGDNAFKGNGIKTITISNGIEYIGVEAFRDCTNLSTINLPNSIIAINDAAFYNCTSLTSTNIPSNVKSIACGVFYGCKSLESITILEGITYIGNGFFAESGLTSITLPTSTKIIGQGAFEHCNLTTLIIPEGVESIDNNAFKDCYNLTNIKIPSSVQSMGDDLFYGCNALQIYEYLASSVQLNRS